MNAKEELLEFVKRTGLEIKCADVIDEQYDGILHKYRLPVDYTKVTLRWFLLGLDFDYDEKYGTQNLFGYIWFTDGTWGERYEYNGSECWVHQSCPEIPKELL